MKTKFQNFRIVEGTLLFEDQMGETHNQRIVHRLEAIYKSQNVCLDILLLRCFLSFEATVPEYRNVLVHVTEEQTLQTIPG